MRRQNTKWTVIMLKLLRVAAFAAMTLSASMLSGGAEAATYVWNISGIFEDSSTLTGTITYDTAINAVSSWSLATDLDGYSYDGSIPDQGGNFYIFYGDAGAGELDLTFSANLGNPANSPLSFTGYEFNNYAELDVDNPLLDVSSGTATLANKQSTDVPEPTSLALLGTGILLLGAGVRRRLRS